MSGWLEVLIERKWAKERREEDAAALAERRRRQLAEWEGDIEYESWFATAQAADGDEFDETDDSESDPLDEAAMECGMGPDGTCLNAGSEWCDWDCPFSGDLSPPPGSAAA